MKKLVLFITIITLAFISFLVWYNMPKEYEITYQQNDFQITEKYLKEEQVYQFIVQKEDYTYEWVENQKYIKRRKIIETIEEIQNEDEICIAMKSKEIDISPVCKKDNQYIDYHMVNSKIKEQLSSMKTLEESQTETYQNIEITNLDRYDYLLWNYKGFYHISEKGKEEIPLFSKDIYNIHIAGIVGNYMIVADYEQEHNFDRLYVINLKNNSVEEWKLKNEISFDSYIAGSKDKSIYLVDKKNKIEYELVPHKKKMRKVGTSDKKGRIYQNGWEKISLTKLANEEYHFEDKKLYHYEIMDEKLYRKDIARDVLISSFPVKHIVTELNDSVFYFTNNTLYRYDPIYGERKVMENFEWNFNYQDMVFIY